MPILVPREELPQLRTRDLSVLASQMDLSTPALGFLTPHASFETVLQSLLNHEHWFDALSLLAHALTPREAIWWSGLVCGKRVVADATASHAEEASTLLALVREWVLEPEEERRMAVHDAAAQIPNIAPAHWVGMAVFWSTGNITPDAGVVTPPPPYLYARGVSAAIDLAASLAAMERLAVYEDAFRIGIDIASGGSGEDSSVAEET